MNLALTEFYAERPCRICGKPMFCRHREPEADMAELSAFADSLTRYKALAFSAWLDKTQHAPQKLSA